MDRIAARRRHRVQHRMAYQGEYFVERHGAGAGRRRRQSPNVEGIMSQAARTPPASPPQSLGLAGLVGRKDRRRDVALSAAKLLDRERRAAHVDGERDLVLNEEGKGALGRPARGSDRA
jgi:hypothetical protein